MKNRKKGFTLIEMILVVALLSVIGIVITVNLTGTLKDTNQKKCDDFVSEIETAACTYVGWSYREIACNRPGCDINISILVNEGLIKSETDACTGEDIDMNATVSVQWDSTTGEKSCTYNGVKIYER